MLQPSTEMPKHASVEENFVTKLIPVGDARNFHFLLVARLLIQGKYKAGEYALGWRVEPRSG